MSETKSKYGPEVKYKRGLAELLDAIAAYKVPENAPTAPHEYFINLLNSGNCQILEVGSGWEKEAVDALADYGPSIKWVSVNPMLSNSDHNQRVAEQIDEHVWNGPIRRALQSHGIVEPPRRAVAAESKGLPFRDNSFNVALASWSVPTVMEEQIVGKLDWRDESERLEANHAIRSLIEDTCKEYGRLLTSDGVVITFPIRDPELVDSMIESLNRYGNWSHVVCQASDNTYYTKDRKDKVNYLLFSIRTNET